MRHIALAAGGSGGHFFPAEALARELTRRGHKVMILTDSRGATYAERLGEIELVTLPAAAIGAGLIGKAKTATVIARATWLARRELQRIRGEIVVTFGGYPSFAPALAAKSLGLPLILHDQSAKLSLANQYLLKLCTKLATSFPVVKGTGALPHEKIVETGNPVRGEIIALRDAAYAAPTATGSIHLLVTGGSQSASIFGEVVPPALLALPESLRQRLHLSLQYKGDDAATVETQLQEAGIAVAVAPFFRDMPARLAQAHLVICRAGASTAAELLVTGRPAIFVPIPKGGSVEEQLKNAQMMEAAGAGWCQVQSDLTPAGLSARLQHLLAAPEVLAHAAAAAHRLGKPNAAAKLADLVEATAG